MQGAADIVHGPAADLHAFTLRDPAGFREKERRSRRLY